MSMYDLIVKKKRGIALSREEIEWMIDAYVEGGIPDYQMSALMMAVCFQGMNKEETLWLTNAMAKSGDMLDLSGIRGIKADKHSTGGVGDKTSLVLAPLVASLDIPVAKMSGRGLGHTGGTIDKLESFQGFSTSLTKQQFIDNVNSIHIALAGQTGDLAPADKKLYALRDVTGTVDQMSLIASSIMSKKLASGADAIVLDVKTGSGAFMKTQEDSIALAEEMVNIGKMAGKRMAAVISDMDQPLGYAVGNALEVKEAIDTLKGHGPSDLEELVLVLGSLMVEMADEKKDADTAEILLKENLHNGKAFAKFLQFIEAQGGDIKQAENTELLPKAQIIEEVLSEKSGFVSNIAAEEIGSISLLLGGGRVTKDSIIDLSVGVVLKKKKGDFVEAGEALAVVHASGKSELIEAKRRLADAYEIVSDKVLKAPLIKKIIK